MPSQWTVLWYDKLIISHIGGIIFIEIKHMLQLYVFLHHDIEDNIHSKILHFVLLYLNLKWQNCFSVGYKTKQSSTDMLYGNIILAGVIADYLIPHGSGDDPPPSQSQWYCHTAHLFCVVLFWTFGGVVIPLQ